jgi:transcriptional regulator with AAA-type ATPase domain
MKNRTFDFFMRNFYTFNKVIEQEGIELKRIDLIEKTLAKLSSSHGATAGELAASLGLSRANVSNDLNRLCDEGKAEKEGSKPVYYRIATAAIHQKAGYFLNAFVQDNPSLFHCVEQAKAAVLYPPHGMHMLLFGETGVGKSIFAEMIYRYANENGFLSSTAQFVVFNCADYTDNPQLLVSQLMGTKKGAFTGADADRPGLLEKANGGILFLDEVHRLPPQGQEMLFTFIDKGIYRRLGETDMERKASVLLICATTENPDSNLLKTFTRRIPMILKIPNLSERSMDERLNLISRFFMDESARLGKPISISVNSVRSLLSYYCPNNIGQLKSDIQIICAKAYSDYISGIKSELCVVSMDLPDHIREGLTRGTSHRKIWSRFVGINKRFCVFDSKLEAPLKNEKENESIYDIIDSRMQELKNTETDREKITEKVNQDILMYFEKYSQISVQAEDFSSIRNLVGMDVIYMVDKIISYAEEK